MSIIARLQTLFHPGRRAEAEYDTPRNRGWVITLCILASCVLWFAFSMQETYTQVIEFPTEVRNLPDDQALAQMPPSSVRVQLEGEGIQILRLYYNPPSVPIDASQDVVDLGLSAPEIVKSVSIQAVTPRLVDMSVEDRVSRRIPVEPRITMQFASGYRMIGTIKSVPDSITVSGARSIIQNLRSWPTARRHLGEMRDSLNAAIALSDTLGSLVLTDVSEVIVKEDVQAFTGATRQVAVRAVGLPPGVRVTFSPAVVDVIYQVPLSQYDKAMEAEEFYAFVPYSDIERDTQGLVFPMLHLPDSLDVRGPRFEPESLRYYDVRRDD